MPTLNEADSSQDWYCFERYVDRTLGGKGFADVWRKGRFGWEYKGAHANLAAAYGWPPDIGGEEILERLLSLNLERASG